MHLRPLEPSDLATVALWFEDAETQHWLGGPDWPQIGLRLRGPNRHNYLAFDGAAAVGLTDVEIYHDRRASFAPVIAPHMRRRGLGTALIAAIARHPDLWEVDELFAGVERDNRASEALLRRSGFQRMSDEDEDGFTYFALRWRGTLAKPWRLPV